MIVLLIRKKPHLEINLDDLPSDPGLRRKISDYHPNDHDKIRMAYLQKGVHYVFLSLNYFF